MVPTREILAVVLVAAFVSLTLALPKDERSAQKPEETVVMHLDTQQDAVVKSKSPEGRFLEPAFFGVKKKKFTIGKYGVATFFRAWRNCIDEGKSLATIETEEEQRRIEAMIADHDTNYWIAATNLGAEDFALTWITTDLAVETTPSGLELTGPSCISMTVVITAQPQAGD
uniref:C-type lectin domain-containing protein n=1 Tax=Anopheles dirus TaxID=7168 RepID=A0A182NNG9_9DIPT